MYVCNPLLGGSSLKTTTISNLTSLFLILPLYPRQPYLPDFPLKFHSCSGKPQLLPIEFLQNPLWFPSLRCPSKSKLVQNSILGYLISQWFLLTTHKATELYGGKVLKLFSFQLRSSGHLSSKPYFFGSFPKDTPFKNLSDLLEQHITHFKIVLILRESTTPLNCNEKQSIF